MYNPFDITGKIFLVTGASSGIGQSVTVSLSKMNAKVIYTGRDKDKLLATEQLIEGDGHLKIIADLTVEEDLVKLLSLIPKIDGVVHCAGILNILPLKLVLRHQFLDTLKINYEVPYFLTQKLLKEKKLNKGCSIVFLSSINGNNIGVQGFTSYAGTKAAIVGFAKALAMELAPKYRVNCILPGMIKTPMYLEMEKTISKTKVEADKLLYPMRDYGEPEDISNAVIYLLSKASKWVTGTSLTIDGGISIR